MDDRTQKVFTSYLSGDSWASLFTAYFCDAWASLFIYAMICVLRTIQEYFIYVEPIVKHSWAKTVVYLIFRKQNVAFSLAGRARRPRTLQVGCWFGISHWYAGNISVNGSIALSACQNLSRVIAARFSLQFRHCM